MGKQRGAVHKQVVTRGFVSGDITILCGTSGRGYVETAQKSRRWADVTCKRCLYLKKGDSR